MCGITGEIRFDGAPADVPAVRRATEAMTRRGPDSEGFYRAPDGRAALGHRRLKIIDLSDASSQPMVDRRSGLAIAYNGAIYNYRELRRELEAEGHTFVSEGDTEVILRGFDAWGTKVVERLQGMFAFAIWNDHSKEMFLARDRMGIKPLYFAADTRRMRFASSLPALLETRDVDTAIDHVALQYYMTFHAVVPPPRTILAGIRKLAPAHWMRVDSDGTTTIHRYWSTAMGPQEGDADRSEEEWQALTLDTLRRAVSRRTVADVPVGVLLSGGLDSSLITGLLAESQDGEISTYSIGFDSIGEEDGDEFRYSDIIADHFGTRHHKIRIDAERTLTALPDCISAMSEPMVSHDNIGFYLLSQEVSKDIKVVMSGQGADEIFAGYHWYPPLVARDAEDATNAYADVFFDRDLDEYHQAVSPAYRNGDAARDFVARHFAQPGAPRAIDKALRIDQHVMLVDDPVKRVDNQTMAWGLEARVPFLDHEVVELAARMPAEIKVANGGKHVLKEAARQVVPSAVIDRPKGYFSVPALKYLRGPYLETVREVLNQQAARDRGLFNRTYVDRLLQDPESHITPLRGSKLWQLALLEMWLQANI